LSSTEHHATPWQPARLCPSQLESASYSYRILSGGHTKIVLPDQMDISPLGNTLTRNPFLVLIFSSRLGKSSESTACSQNFIRDTLKMAAPSKLIIWELLRSTPSSQKMSRQSSQRRVRTGECNLSGLGPRSHSVDAVLSRWTARKEYTQNHYLLQVFTKHISPNWNH